MKQDKSYVNVSAGDSSADQKMIFSNGSADKKKKPDLSRLVPLGIDHERGIRLYITWLIVAALYSLPVLIRYRNCYSQIFWTTGTAQKVLREGAVIAPLNEVLGTHMLGFAAVALSMAGVAVYHYIYHRQGSKSIYLMKRLPDRMELHRRCLSLPLIGMAAAIVTGLLFFGIYAAIYFLVTPEEAIAAGQLSTLWRIRL